MQVAVSLVAEARAARDAEATRLGLSQWMGAIGELRRLTDRYRDEAMHLVGAAQEAHLRAERSEQLREEADKARLRSGRAAHDAVAARTEATRVSAHAAALAEKVGATRDQLLGKLREAETLLGDVRRRLRASEDALPGANAKKGEAQARREQAEVAVTNAEAGRRSAETGFKDFARRRLLAIAGIAGDREPPDQWTFTETLETARQVDVATAKIDASPSECEAQENRVSGRHQELLRTVSGDVRMLPHRVDGLLEYHAVWNGRPMDLLALVDELAGDVAERERRLASDERELFESFLTGRTHDHLQARLRGARALVNRMNGELGKRPTPSGAQIQLKWEVTADAPAGTSEAVDLLLRAGHLLTEADKSALTTFLQQRLKIARTQDGAGALLERMLAVLDYRSWFAFSVEHRDGTGRPWKVLTRKEHGAGSGGRKAVMLHLPLFAAAAAFYESAQPDPKAAKTTARLVVLDEAFAGIDRPMRAELMGLLVEFDLDFVMTSYDEWGFYSQLDGLSTYHLSREQGFPGVHADWFQWDGQRRIQMGAQ